MSFDGFDLRAHTHLLVVGGSRAYGLHSDTSDVDLKGVAVPPAAWLHGFANHFEQADDTGEMDVFVDCLTDAEQAVVAATKLEGSVYALAKFARLAFDANPHMLDALFCRDSEVRLCTPIGAALREAAPRFLSLRARHSFGGYAAAQLKRIQNHRRWLLEPPDVKPTRAEFGLPEHTVIAKDQLAAAEAAIRKQVDRWELDLSQVDKSTAQEIQDRIARVLAEIEVGEDEKWVAAAHHVGLTDDFAQLMLAERRYKRAKQEYRQHQHWKRNRNPDRAALEAKYGYDTKHGAHLVRLLTMAVEIVSTGQVHVWRGDRDAAELRAIKGGDWPYEKLLAWVEATEEQLQAAVPGSPLPKRPDRDALDALVVRLTQQALRLGRHATSSESSGEPRKRST